MSSQENIQQAAAVFFGLAMLAGVQYLTLQERRYHRQFETVRFEPSTCPGSPSTDPKVVEIAAPIYEKRDAVYSACFPSREVNNSFHISLKVRQNENLDLSDCNDPLVEK